MKKTLIALVLVVATAAAAFAIPALAASTKTVKVSDSKFSPKSLTVKKGTTINWKWGGIATLTTSP